MASVQKISPFLMFDGPVEEAARFYVSVFPNSEIKSVSPMSATIVANGIEIVMFKDQAEVDLYWNKFLAGGGREDNCGWLQDKWGVSWQIIPDALGRYLSDPDREKANRVVETMLKMKKIIVADLDKAYAS
jgi:predicted 3-demethylubiquinone-9 3-methyltransferase (glyoxalase superfamily)